MPSTDKSDTIKTFKNLVETSSIKPDFTTEVLDGAAELDTANSEGLIQGNKFTAYLFNKYCLSTLNRVDIVFNIYLDHSNKNSTRNKRGFCKQIKVTGDRPIPRQWKSFICVNENNMQLFQL